MAKEDPKGYLTISAAAQHLGLSGKWAGQRLRRLLLAKESYAGCRIMIRLHGTKEPKLRVTIPMLRRHCPELFNRRDELAVELRQRMEKIEDDISELFQRDDELAGAIARLKNESERVKTSHRLAIG